MPRKSRKKSRARGSRRKGVSRPKSPAIPSPTSTAATASTSTSSPSDFPEIGLLEALIHQRESLGYDTSELEKIVLGIKGKKSVQQELQEYIQANAKKFDTKDPAGAAAFELFDEAAKLSADSLEASREQAIQIYDKLKFLRGLAARTQGEQSEIAKKLDEAIKPVEERLQKQLSLGAFLKDKTKGFAQATSEKLLSKIPIVGGFLGGYIRDKRERNESIRKYTGSLAGSLSLLGRKGLMQPSMSSIGGRGGGLSDAMRSMGGTTVASLAGIGKGKQGGFGGLGGRSLGQVSETLNRIREDVSGIHSILRDTYGSSTDDLTARESQLEGILGLKGGKGGGGGGKGGGGILQKLLGGGKPGETPSAAAAGGSWWDTAKNLLFGGTAIAGGGAATTAAASAAPSLAYTAGTMAGSAAPAVAAAAPIAVAAGGLAAGTAAAYGINKYLDSQFGYEEGDGLADHQMRASTYNPLEILDLTAYDSNVDTKMNVQQGVDSMENVSGKIVKGEATAMEIAKAVKIGSISAYNADSWISQAIKKGNYDPEFFKYYTEVYAELMAADKEGGSRLVGLQKNLQTIKEKYGFDKKDERLGLTKKQDQANQAKSSAAAEKVGTVSQEEKDAKLMDQIAGEIGFEGNWREDPAKRMAVMSAYAKTLPPEQQAKMVAQIERMKTKFGDNVPQLDEASSQKVSQYESAAAGAAYASSISPEEKTRYMEELSRRASDQSLSEEERNESRRKLDQIMKGETKYAATLSEEEQNRYVGDIKSRASDPNLDEKQRMLAQEQARYIEDNLEFEKKMAMPSVEEEKEKIAKELGYGPDWEDDNGKRGHVDLEYDHKVDLQTLRDEYGMDGSKGYKKINGIFVDENNKALNPAYQEIVDDALERQKKMESVASGIPEKKVTIKGGELAEIERIRNQLQMNFGKVAPTQPNTTVGNMMNQYEAERNALDEELAAANAAGAAQNNNVVQNNVNNNTTNNFNDDLRIRNNEPTLKQAQQSVINW